MEHGQHKTTFRVTDRGQTWMIYDWRKYRDLAGYCSGQDDVSMTLDLYGVWEPEDQAMFRKVISEPGFMLDFGAHIGWYAVQAAVMGCEVLAIEPDPENARLLTHNLQLQGASAEIQLCWADEARVPVRPIRLLKSDTEGGEFEVIELTLEQWKRREIDYAFLEISPVFRRYYPDLVDQLIGFGYRAFMFERGVERSITAKDCTFDQANLWFERL